MPIAPEKPASELAGHAKAPLPKLTPSERLHAKHWLETVPSDADPVVALRLSLIVKKPILPAWKDANVIDMALSTSDIGRRIADLTERCVFVSATPIIEVLERRSRTSPLPVFRTLFAVSTPRVGKKAPRVVQVWDSETAIRVLSLAIKLAPSLLGGKVTKVTKAIPGQMLEIAAATVLTHRSPELAMLGIRLLSVLEREAGWQALESKSLSSTRAALVALPSALALDLLEKSSLSQLNGLSEVVKQIREAENLFRSATSEAATSHPDRLPIASRAWVANYAQQPTPGHTERNEATITSSDAAFERLALILINSWDARSEGERSGYSFAITQDVLKTGFDLYITGEPGSTITFDPSVHEGPSSLRAGDAAKLVRPWIELRRGADIQILIKGIVEAQTR